MFGLYCTCRRRICPTVSTTSVASALGGKSISERLYSTIWLADLGADCCRSKSAPADSANSAPSGGPSLLPLRPASLTGIFRSLSLRSTGSELAIMMARAQPVQQPWPRLQPDSRDDRCT